MKAQLLEVIQEQKSLRAKQVAMTIEQESKLSTRLS